ncbi:hypothetical protein EDB85DRAFT_2290128 [Lactarius pseudohatsudake]|nr:hypothetical protein EDB85DRAFT_2290128 [Lactarius pseudohatsudake]
MLPSALCARPHFPAVCALSKRGAPVHFAAFPRSPNYCVPPRTQSYTPPAGTSSTPSVAATLARPLHREFIHAHLRPARGSTPSAQLFGVSYSEHSPFFELTCFVLSLDWARIVPTVNVESAASRAKISTWIARWEEERRKRPPGVVPPYRTPEYWLQER